MTHANRNIAPYFTAAAESRESEKIAPQNNARDRIAKSPAKTTHYLKKTYCPKTRMTALQKPQYSALPMPIAPEKTARNARHNGAFGNVCALKIFKFFSIRGICALSPSILSLQNRPPCKRPFAKANFDFYAVSRIGNSNLGDSAR
ncbi:MAG: hypothetical protein DBX55_05040 [Verrucomicrobia bacterium]|nr:MAG: hypothetical protein DBX55_05040 [Verrucomicrobiota bacterium]